MFFALGIANQGVAVDSLERMLSAEVDRLSRDGVTAAELAKARNQYRASKVTERQQAFALAEAIQYATAYLGSPDAVNTDLERYAKVTVDDIKRVAGTYLRRDNSFTLVIVPEGK